MLRSLSRNFVVFCFVGAISSLIDIAILYILVENAQFPVLAAAAVSLVVASINGFVLNKLITFKDTSVQIKRQYLYYLSVSAVGLMFTLLLLYFFIEVLTIYYIYAKLFTIVIVTAWNFTANNMLVFKNQRSKIPDASVTEKTAPLIRQ